MENSDETALLLHCPRAEPAVAGQRSANDDAAEEGVPAHVTVIFPFKPLDAIDDDDHDRLAALFAEVEPFVLQGSRTGWFGERVLYVAPDDPAPVNDLMSRVLAAYPDYPPYRGEHAEVIPHLTIGHDRPLEVLREAERQVLARLPFVQPIEQVELWAGPSTDVTGEPVTWRCLRRYPLGGGPARTD